MFCFFFFKQKTAYEMRISDWSSDVCSSDLGHQRHPGRRSRRTQARHGGRRPRPLPDRRYRARRRRIPRIAADRKSVVEGKSVSVRVDLGGRRIIKKKKKANITK